MNAEDSNRDRAVKSLPEDEDNLSLQSDHPGDPRPPQRGWRRFLWPAVIGLVLLGGVGWIVFNRVILPLIFFSQMKAPPPTQVSLANPKSAAVEDSSDYAANLDSRQAVTLQPRVDGQISAIYVKAGDRVATGQPILQIDAGQQRAQVQSRAAAAETAQADIAAAQADVTNARDTLKALQAQRISDLANVQLNQADYKRYQELSSQGATSQQLLEQRLNALQISQATLSQTEAQIRAQQSSIAKAQATVVRNQRALQEAQANVAEGEAQLRYYTITAPFSGVVGNIPVKVGDFVDTSNQMLTVAQNQELEVEIEIPLERASDLRQGMAVQLLDEQSKALQTGRISFISPNVDPSSQSVQVKARFQNPGGELRTEQFARARVIWATRPGVLVPITAVSRLGGENFVFVATPYKDSKCEAAAPAAPGAAQIEPEQTVAVQKPVQLGRIVDNDQEVVEGLSANERIVVSGILQLQNCAPIAAATQSAAAP